MSVRKNVAFGLKYRKVSPSEIKERTQKIMKLVHIDEYADRSPERLSGGQQQRVALARALVIQPDVLLMDEPLSNLDAKLRVEMRAAIKNIQHSVGITTVYVTHDQEEAMAISDRVAVMKDGEIQHIGTPMDIYQRPANLFVATFIGRTNVLEANLEMANGIPILKFACGYAVEMHNVKEQYRHNQKVLVSLRPEELRLSSPEKSSIRARINDSMFLGLNTYYLAHLQTGEEVEIVQESNIGNIFPSGTDIFVAANTEKINIFTADGNQNITAGINSCGTAGKNE
jgi:iron(III) transport system ATP-binding protein